jgi:hypothetical protein
MFTRLRLITAAAFALLAFSASAHADPMPKELIGKWCLANNDAATSTAQYEPCAYPEFELLPSGAVEHQEFGCSHANVRAISFDGDERYIAEKYQLRKYQIRFTGCTGERRKPITFQMYFNRHQGLLVINNK